MICSPAPEVPSIDQAYSKHSDSITVEFTQVSGATSYILRAESVIGDFFSETVVSSSPGTVMELQPFTEYKLSVMSVNSGGRSQPSYPIQAGTGVEKSLTLETQIHFTVWLDCLKLDYRMKL
uniref:Fibronectin type-III domain-containing protein n=1 Tax=Labrus bergylta TaxID=56723 RepID=A0A3Q3FTV2_9LABR